MNLKARVFVAVHGEDFVILACTVLINRRVWQTDRQAGRRTPRWWLRCVKHSPVARKKASHHVIVEEMYLCRCDVQCSLHFWWSLSSSLACQCFHGVL